MNYMTLVLIGCVLLLVTAVAVLFAVRRRERVAAALRVEIAHGRSLIERAHQSFAEITADGTIREWNKHLSDLLGTSREDAIGKNFPTIAVSESQRSGFEAVIAKHASPNVDPTESTMIVLDLVMRREGSYRVEYLPVSLKIWATPSPNEKRFCILVQDLTAEHAIIRQKEAMINREHQLVSELREADQSKMEFMATVTHELRTPLTSMVGYIEMLKDGYGGDLTENQLHMLETIDRNSQRVLSLIDDVLTLTRVESKSAKLHPTTIHPADLLNGVQQAMYPVVARKGLWCGVEIEGEVPTFEADYSQIERVILNAVTNSSKFTEEGGTITLSCTYDNDNVYLHVEDTGCGIPPEDLERVASKFYRTSHSHEKAVQGSGLGLAIVKSIVERHKGELSIESTVGVGTKVSVRIPRIFVGNDGVIE